MKYFIVLLCLSSLVIAKKITCPDKKSTCPESNTCCELVDGSYGCCVAKNGICCEDHIHCCPQNTKCSNGDCIQTYTYNTTRSGLPLTRSNDIKCPDKNSTCPDDTTCCLNPDSQNYQCCPMADAVCCGDGEHCCPAGTTCDLSRQTCQGDRFKQAMYATKKTMNEVPKSVEWATISMRQQVSKTGRLTSVCPGSESECPDDSTCCLRPDGRWGCCPYDNAVCCNDGLHCCPEDTLCDVTSLQCTRQGSSHRVMAASKNQLAHRVGNVSSVVCPGSQVQCPNGYTCCQLSSGAWGCCPFEKATCCKDGLHCCPESMHCDETSQYCSQVDGIRIAASRSKLPAQKIAEENTACPDQTQCEDLDTCCKISASKYGCCPYADATCCKDMQHCCPKGYACDLATTKCHRN